MTFEEVKKEIKEMCSYDRNYDHYVMTEPDMDILANEILKKIVDKQEIENVPLKDVEILMEDSVTISKSEYDIMIKCCKDLDRVDFSL